MKIVFMGTPEFAVASLDILVSNNYDVAAVVTVPDKPAGRGQQLSESAVKKYAVEKGIKVLQPEKLRNPDFIAELQSLNADLFIVVAFRMLPEVVWTMPSKGTFNLHGSLLPQYRGAAPINWAVINGDHETGVTTFFLKHEIDTGNIIFNVHTPITDQDNAGTIHDRLMEIGAELVLKTVKAIENNEVIAKTQDDVIAELGLQPSDLRHAPKIFKDDCKIDWNQSTEKIFNLIRGLSPYPTAFTELNGLGLKIFKVEKELENHGKTPGEVVSDGKKFLKFTTDDGYINVLELQLQGKKRMTTEDFLRGYKL
ncbi:methionyl-tRNA formyltransferase [Solitalea sp. MAHUQ-68]|uniref:Methionyl-tRNA formyltransferase n=1 Tax=Solitalea agri TaxID=2953739 RepID=A0A9X2F173_9SPHI|nr:methionyl-tRNA formyltransferase [Solitalea agri]MCO4292219.1 methionyl-tRNA formyltransferase [Solitalea agri]